MRTGKMHENRKKSSRKFGESEKVPTFAPAKRKRRLAGRSEKVEKFPEKILSFPKQYLSLRSVSLYDRV